MSKKNICYRQKTVVDRQNEKIDAARRKGKRLVKFVDCTDEDRERLFYFFGGGLFGNYYSVKLINGEYYVSLDYDKCEWKGLERRTSRELN